jgi:hypothetical protein
MKPSVIGAVAMIVAALCFVPSLAAAEPLRSGLQPGEHVTTVFEPFNVNGPAAGEPHCLVCENGLAPVAMIFATDVDEQLTKLIGKLDAAAVKHAAAELGSFAVFVNDDEALEARLKKVAEKQALKKFVLSIEAKPGLPEYKIAPEAVVTVMLYDRHEVKLNHAFRKGELTDAAIEKILADVPKLLGEK